MTYVASSPATDIANYLQAAGFGTIGTPTGTTGAIAIGYEPPVDSAGKLEKCLTCYDTGGYDPDPLGRLDKPTVQVRYRGARGGFFAAWAFGQSVRDYLLGKNNFTVNSRRYVAIWLEGDLTHLMNDEAGRPILTLNIRTMRSPAP